MQPTLESDYQTQVEEALQRLKWKKVLYLYDEAGNRSILGVFSRSKALEIKRYLQSKKMLNRLTEFEVRTTEPDSVFKY